MTALWTRSDDGWQALSPTGFDLEDELHRLVDDAPEILPLAGAPRLTVVGKEVGLGGNRADLVAVEETGRLCVIEVKLRSNTESRRAVVAQLLSYAGYLRGVTVLQLERDILGSQLVGRGFNSLADAGQQAGQGGSFDGAVFAEGLSQSLRNGGFRLVLVLDDAPEELVRTTAYLQSVANGPIIDLITVSAYRLGNQQILVPRRIDSTPWVDSDDAPSTSQRKALGESASGAAGFIDAANLAPEPDRSTLLRLARWAEALEHQGLIKLTTYWGKRGEVTLLPRLRPDNAGLITVWNFNGRPSLQLWPSVFHRRAPSALDRIEALLGPLKQGMSIDRFDDELLGLVAEGYREANQGS